MKSICTSCTGEAKALLSCWYSSSLIQYPVGGTERAWWSSGCREIPFNYLFCLCPEQQLQCPVVAPMKGVLWRREIPEMEQILLQAAENTSYFRAVFRSRRAVKGYSCPGHFERQEAQSIQQLSMPIAKSALSNAFLPLFSQKREPARCPSLPAHPFGAKDLGRCQAAATLFELLSFVLLFNKPKKLAKKKCKELHSLQKQVRRCRGDLRFDSQTWQYCPGLTIL